LKSEELFEAMAELDSYSKRVDFLNENQKFITMDFIWDLYYHCELFFEQREYSIALELCRLGEWLSSGKNDTLKFHFLMEQIKNLSRLGRKELAYKKLLEAKAFCNMLAHEVKGGFLIDTGMVFQEEGYLDEALSSFVEAKNSFTINNDIYGLIASLTDIGVNYCERENIEKARDYFIEARDLAVNDYNSPQILTNILLGLGYSYDLQENYDTARDYYSQALSVSTQWQDTLKRGHILYNLAFTGKKMRMDDLSFCFYEECCAILRNLDIAFAESYYFFYRGMVLREVELWDEANRSWCKSLFSMDKAGKSDNKKTIEFYTGDINELKSHYGDMNLSIFDEFFCTYSYRGKREFSLAPYKGEWKVSKEPLIEEIKNYKFASPLGEYRVLVSSLKNLGHLYVARGRYRKALSIFREAISVQWKRGDFSGLAATLEGLGRTYRKLNKEKHAILFYSEASVRSISEKTNDMEDFDKRDGWIYLFLEQPEFAFFLWSKELNRDKSLSNLLRLARLYLGLELYKEAFFFLDKTAGI
jgi:tetratricopeptide (TPR) repeat protein